MVIYRPDEHSETTDDGITPASDTNSSVTITVVLNHRHGFGNIGEKINGNVKIAPYHKKDVFVKIILSDKSFHPLLHSEFLSETGISKSMVILAKSLMFKLLCSEMESSNGINLTADRPYSANGLMNVTRPAVLRIFLE